MDYPEFEPLVKELVKDAVIKINHNAIKIESEMRYKCQYTLEMLINELQKLV